MQQLCDLLPKEDESAELPVIYDTRFSEELLGRMKNVVANRYGEGERHIIPPTFFGKREGADTFHAVLAFVSDEMKEQAAAHLKQKFWEWADRYFEGLYPIIREQKRLEKKLERIHREIDELSVQKLRQKKPAALPVRIARHAGSEHAYERYRERSPADWQAAGRTGRSA